MKTLLVVLALSFSCYAQVVNPGGGSGGGGSGTVTSVTIAGTASQITVTGTCTGTATVTCTLSIPSGLQIPGTINKITLTQPATGATMTLLDGKTFTINNTLTLAGTDATTITFQGTDTYVGRSTTDTLSNKTLVAPALGTPVSGVGTNLTGIPNSALINTGTTVNGTVCTLGSTCTVTASATSLPYCNATGGATNTLVSTCSPAVTVYSNGTVFNLKVDAANTGATTINTNSTGIKNLFLKGASLPSGALQQCVTGGCSAYYDGTQFNLISPNSSNIFNVRDFGAIPNGSTDNYNAISAAYTAACAASSLLVTGTGVSVYFPGSKLPYSYAKVPHSSCSNISTSGDGLSSVLSPLYEGGAAYLVGPAVGSGMSALPTSTSLLTGSGNSMVLDNTGSYINLSDSANTRLNGLPAFDVQFAIKFTTLADGIIMSSSGTSNAFAFGIELRSSNLVTTLTTVGCGCQGGYSSGTLSTGVVYVVEVSYDGTTTRTFLNGALYSSFTQSGTLVQKVTEDFLLPGRLQDWPEGDLNQGGPSALIDSVRISNIARNTSAYTAPTAKYSSDSNTIMLLNFDNQYDVFTVGKIGLSPSSLPEAHYMYRTPYTQNINQSSLNNITFSNTDAAGAGDWPNNHQRRSGEPFRYNR